MKPITNTFVLVAPDCLAASGVVPTSKGESPTIAVIQYELLTARPYTLTLEDLIFATHVRRIGLYCAGSQSPGRRDPGLAFRQASSVHAGLPLAEEVRLGRSSRRSRADRNLRRRHGRLPAVRERISRRHRRRSARFGVSGPRNFKPRGFLHDDGPPRTAWCFQSDSRRARRQFFKARRYEWRG